MSEVIGFRFWAGRPEGLHDRRLSRGHAPRAESREPKAIRPEPTPDMSFITAAGIVKRYPVGGTSLTVLRDLDLQVAAGEMNASVGAPWGGKSTLLHLVGGLH